MPELNGYIKIHRKLLQWGWYQDNVVKGVFFHLLLTASFRPMSWMGQTIQPGQLVTSCRRLAEELGFSQKQIRTALDKLASTQEVAIKTTNKYSVITVVNWESYQGNDYFGANKRANEGQTDLITKLLQSAEALKNAANKTADKKNLESAINTIVIDLNEFARANSWAIEGQTKGKQRANEGQHRNNIKNVKNDKNIYIRAREGLDSENPTPLCTGETEEERRARIAELRE